MEPQARGVRWIVVYKLVKAALEGALAVALGVLLVAGWGPRLHEVARLFLGHVNAAWSIMLARWVFQLTTQRWLEGAVVALGLDAALSFAEGWSLHRGLRWGPWFVVVATGSLLPLEVVQMARRFRAGRLVLFGVNVLVVVYLLRRIRRERVNAQSSP